MYEAHDDGKFGGRPVDFRGTKKRPLSQMSAEALAAACTYVEYASVHLRGVLFRAKTRTRLSTTDNTGVMLPVADLVIAPAAASDIDSDDEPIGNKRRRLNGQAPVPQPDEQPVLYGRLQRIIAFQPPGVINPIVVFQVEWFDNNGTVMGGRVPRVKQNPDSAHNRYYGFTLANKFYAQNVVFWPEDLRKPMDDSYLAIYRGTQSRPLDRGE